MIQQIIALEQLHPGSGFYFFRTQVGAEVDLLNRPRAEPRRLLAGAADW